MVVKNPPANAGGTRDMGSVLRLGRSPLVGNGYFLQYSCLENSLDREAWWATVQRDLKRIVHDCARAHTHYALSTVSQGYSEGHWTGNIRKFVLIWMLLVTHCVNLDKSFPFCGF